MRPLLRNAVSFLPIFCAFLLLGSCRNPKQLLPDHPQLAAGVNMQDVSFTSAALGRQMPYRVFFPAQISTGQRLPVVYLLHGNGGGYRDWSNNSDVARYAALGLILVMPEGNASYFMNAVEKPRDKYEDYLTRDLVADVEARFPVREGRGNRAIVGVSMGGFAAIEIGLTHSDMFAFSGAISPAIDVPERRFSWKRAGQWWAFRTIFGSLGSKERQARDPFVSVQSSDPRTAPYFYLAAGEQEPLLEPIQRFAARLGKHGLAHEFHTKPGGHDWPEWDQQIPGCFESLFVKLRAAQGN